MSEGRTSISKVSVTRPNDTTTYAAGDVMDTAAGGGWVFPNVVGSAGDHGLVFSGKLISSNNATLKGSYELWLFSKAPAATADNAAAAISDADMAYYLGRLTFTTALVGNAGAAAAGNCVFENDPNDRAIPIVIPGTSLYGLLVIRNAYVPVAQEITTIILGILLD